MFDVLPDRVPWYVVGPGLGLLIIVFYSLSNQPLGASGAYAQTVMFLRRRPGVAVWRVWYFVGMFVGGVVVTQVLRSGAEVRSGYDAMRAVWSLAPSWWRWLRLGPRFSATAPRSPAVAPAVMGYVARRSDHPPAWPTPLRSWGLPSQPPFFSV